jgi:hypothetical protein
MGRNTRSIFLANKLTMSVYISYLYSFIIIVGLELSLIKPQFFWWVGGITLLLNALFILFATRSKFNLNFWNFLISPFIFLLSGLAFLGFSNDWIIKEIVIVFLVICNSIFLYWLIVHNYHKHKYKDHSLSNISRIINISSIFFLFSSAYDLRAFLKVPLWLLILVCTLVVYLIIYQFFSISKIKFSTSKIFVIISTFLLIELFYILNWLPIISVAKAVLITSAYYFITSTNRHYIQSTLAKTVWFRYSLVTGIIWFLTLISARWE